MIKLTRQKRPVKRPKFADERWMGPEPQDNISVADSKESVYTEALGWYNYYYKADKAREWIVEYMEANGFDPSKVKTIRSISLSKVVPTAGWISRLLTKGWTLPESTTKFLQDKIEDMLVSETKPETKKAESKNTPNPMQRTEARARALLHMVDDEVDAMMINEDHTFSCYDFLKTQNASPIACKKIMDYAKGCIDDLHFEIEDRGKKPPKRTIKWIAFFESIVSDCDRFLGNKKTTRKPRKTKEKSVQQLVEKVKYLKESPVMKLVSVDPTEIIKAKTLWTYNTKYKQLTVYNANDISGLSIKGTTIINFRPETSVVKRLRKPEPVIEQILKVGKVEARTFMDSIKTTALPAKGRLNEDTILLRVIK